MAIRVVARIRPQQANESEKDVIVSAASVEDGSPSQPTLVRIPSPKNENENFTFQFSGVYDGLATQQSIFDNEGLSTDRVKILTETLKCHSITNHQTPL